MQCCTGNGSQALYYAWESIVRWHDGLAQINLLLNRASPWVDINSYLPYEGKVVVRNKTAPAVAVRIPRWVDRTRMTVTTGGRGVKPVWVGNYALCQGLRGGDEIALEFPLAEHTSTYSLDGKAYRCRFHGQTLLGSRGAANPPSYQMFAGRGGINGQAPLRTVSRYVPERTLAWVARSGKHVARRKLMNPLVRAGRPGRGSASGSSERFRCEGVFFASRPVRDRGSE